LSFISGVKSIVLVYQYKGVKDFEQITKIYTFETMAMGYRQNRQNRLMTPTILFKIDFKCLLKN